MLGGVRSVLSVIRAVAADMVHVIAVIAGACVLNSNLSNITQSAPLNPKPEILTPET